jgi:xanthine dehydrogenase YagS FAD-binding subunit
VNVKGIRELHGIQRTAQGVRIGATTTFDEMASDPALRKEYAGLATAAGAIAGPQIRNMGTLGGNLCQRPRCWYFRMGYGLLALKDGKSLIPNGRNQYHAIFGGGPGYFVSPSSLAPALIVFGAKVKLMSKSGSRLLPVEKFFLNPQSPDTREIALLPNEIVTEVQVPPAQGVRSATYEVREKDSMEWPLAMASVALQMNGRSITKATIVLGHVATTPWIATEAAQGLAGKTLSDDVIEQAAKAAVADAKPLSENGYKVQLTRVAVKRALMEAAGRA